jgi:hypothetical protein
MCGICEDPVVNEFQALATRFSDQKFRAMLVLDEARFDGFIPEGAEDWFDDLYHKVHDILYPEV